MFNWLRTRRPRKTAPAARPKPSTRLDAQPLEDRTTPTVSSITSNFNGTAIPAGDYLWFSSVAKVSGLGTAPATVHVTNQSVSFTAGGIQYFVPIPDSTVVFQPAASSASADFNGEWQVTSPSKYSGNVFLAGTGYQFTSGLPGGIKNVVWSGDFTSDTAGLKINWQWSAAVYTQFSTDPAALGVKPSDAPTTLYPNSHHAGTPESFAPFVVGGARGGGGSNFTGSYSATGSVTPEVVSPPPPAEGSLSGFVFQDINGNGQLDSGEALSGVTVHVVWVDEFNETHDVTTTTGDDGSYRFTGLAAG